MPRANVAPQRFPNLRFWAIMADTDEEIDAAMSLLPQARMRGASGPLVRREYENAAHLLRHACALGELKLALSSAQTTQEKAAAAEGASALADDVRALLAEHRALWLARNRVGGLEEGSGRHLQKMIDAYRRIAQGG